MGERTGRKRQRGTAAGWTAWAVFAAVLFICGAAAAEPLSRLEVGLWSILLKHDSAMPPNELTPTRSEVLEQVVVGEQTYFRIGVWNEHGYSEHLIRSTDTAVYFRRGSDESPVWQIGPIGTSWDFAGETEDGEPGRTYNEIVSIEPVTVPYGTFQNSYVQRCYFVYDSDGTVSPYWYEYLVPGMGRVKEVDYGYPPSLYPPHIGELAFAGKKSFAGVFRNGTWYLDANGNGSWDRQPTDLKINRFGGQPGDIPVTGDWNGDGTHTAGIFRDGAWYLDADGNGSWDRQPTDLKINRFGGQPGDIPVAGDWNGDGIATAGIFRDGTWYLDVNGNGSWDGQPTDMKINRFGGQPGDIPVAGDWNGDGITTAGIFRDGTWYLDLNGNGSWDRQPTDLKINRFGGQPGDIPVTGDWDGTGSAKAGIFRDGTWYLDVNGNGSWDRQPTDMKFRFGGQPGDIPVTGGW